MLGCAMRCPCHDACAAHTVQRHACRPAKLLCREPQHIVMLGTCHVSKKSEADVRRVVRALQPHSVMVELCRSRRWLLNSEAERRKARGRGRQGSTGGGGSGERGAGSAGRSSTSGARAGAFPMHHARLACATTAAVPMLVPQPVQLCKESSPFCCLYEACASMRCTLLRCRRAAREARQRLRGHNRARLPRALLARDGLVLHWLRHRHHAAAGPGDACGQRGAHICVRMACKAFQIAWHFTGHSLRGAFVATSRSCWVEGRWPPASCAQFCGWRSNGI